MNFKYLFFFLGLLLLPNLMFAQQERITNYNVRIITDIDRSITVTENITVYVTGQQIKRGITRNFPASRDMKNRSIKMRYDILEVKKNGQPEPYHTDDSGDFTLYIGERDVLLSPGEYTYTIVYRVPNQIGFFDDYDEIYWNAIGTDVSFVVEQALVQLRVPGGAEIIQYDAYTGSFGQTRKDFTVADTGYFLEFKTTKPLRPHEGFTVAVGFEKGVVTQPSIFERFGTLMVILLGLMILIPYYVYTWYKYGQDPPTPASYPIYESPDGLSAASVNYILKEGYQNKSLTASIINMAIKGYLKIEEVENKGFFSSSKNYDLILLKEADDALPEEERKLMNTLFSNRDVVHIDGEYHKHVENAYNKHKANVRHQHRSMIREGHNERFLGIPLLVTVAAAALAIFIFAKNPYAEGVNLIYIIGFVVIAIIGIILYTWLIKKPTEEKLELKSRINGFKMYLELAEKDRLNLLNPPEMTPQHFEEALPYAFALGVEHKWAEKFKDILEKMKYQPEWTNNPNPIYFSSHFGNSFSRNLAGSATKPSQDGSGGGFSGSGGGGFSGGGGGGGGVGGW